MFIRVDAKADDEHQVDGYTSAQVVDPRRQSLGVVYAYGLGGLTLP
jgi:hypothetical protein